MPATCRGDRHKPPAQTQLALADDRTIKSLTGKIDANPDDVNALYRRGQVYASKEGPNLILRDAGCAGSSG
jgi:hypothetical protein